MLQRFASVLFGGEAEEVRGSRAEEEQEEDWILVDCLGESPHHLLSSSAREEVQASVLTRRSLPSDKRNQSQLFYHEIRPKSTHTHCKLQGHTLQDLFSGLSTFPVAC